MITGSMIGGVITVGDTAGPGRKMGRKRALGRKWTGGAMAGAGLGEGGETFCRIE